MLCDPDVFFYTDVAAHYLELIRTYDLDVVGVINDCWELQCYLEFACSINLVMRRDSLPGPDYLQGDLQFHPVHTLRLADLTGNTRSPDASGYYLVASPIARIAPEFPHPNGYFDTGCNLWYWCYEQGMRWVSYWCSRRATFSTTTTTTTVGRERRTAAARA